MSATLTHLATGPTGHVAIPTTSVPFGLTRKQPLFMRSGPLPTALAKALEIDPRDQPKPDLFRAPKLKEHLSVDHKHIERAVSIVNSLSPSWHSEPTPSPRPQLLPASLMNRRDSRCRHACRTTPSPGSQVRPQEPSGCPKSRRVPLVSSSLRPIGSCSSAHATRPRSTDCAAL